MDKFAEDGRKLVKLGEAMQDGSTPMDDLCRLARDCGMRIVARKIEVQEEPQP